MKDLIKKAKLEIIKTNEDFDYIAGDLEIASNIWHSYLSPQQRLEIMRDFGIKKSVKDAYKAVAEIMK